MRRQREFEAAQAQIAAQQAAERERISQASGNARDIFTLQREQDMANAQMTSSMPMQPAGPVQPQQIPLFTRRQAPIPPRAGQLRRGGRMEMPTPVGEAALKQTQVPLFTQEGQPSVAALRAAGVKTKLPPTPPQPRATTTPGARGLRKGAKVAEVNIVETPSAVQVPSPAPVPTQPAAETRKGVGSKVPAKQKAAGKTEAKEDKKPAAPKSLKKEEPPAPKAEAASAAPVPAPAPAPAPSAKVDGPVALDIELADGSKLKAKDGRKLLAKLDQDINKLEELLVCLVRSR
jgi:hypothetical protein